MQQLEGAIVREQGVTFAIVVVKPAVLRSTAETDQMRASLATIADFDGLPLILASQDSSGRFTYQGRPDIVKFLASIEASRIPWKRYTLSAS